MIGFFVSEGLYIECADAGPVWIFRLAVLATCVNSTARTILMTR